MGGIYKECNVCLGVGYVKDQPANQAIIDSTIETGTYTQQKQAEPARGLGNFSASDNEFPTQQKKRGRPAYKPASAIVEN